jgi:DNA-damage-inducible protein J
MNNSAKQIDTLQVNPKLKAKAETVFKKIGLSSSEAVNAFFAKVINTNGIPFALTATTIDEETIDKKLKEAEDEIRAGIEPLELFAVLKNFEKELGQYAK